MTTVARIRTILTEQIAGYRTLLEVLQREREYLVHFDPAGVEALSKEKDTIVLKLRLLEEERIRLVRSFSVEHGSAEENAFAKLVEITGDDTFPRLRLQLVSLLQGIMELNEFNRVLIERSSSVVNNALNFLGTLGITTHSAGGGLISREA